MINGLTAELTRPLRRQVASARTALKLRLVKCLILQGTPNKISPGQEHHLIKKLNWYQADLPQSPASHQLLCTVRHARTLARSHCSHGVTNPQINPLQSDNINISKLIIVHFSLVSDANVCLAL